MLIKVVTGWASGEEEDDVPLLVAAPVTALLTELAALETRSASLRNMLLLLG